ncbi:MFS transporter [Candidatus Palauibacter sp.]|uniref:MFS transporter n=1 Tax=Candidatus Palauibacter sp. TaxID=3101350 RepID=UPI003B519D2D
MLRRAGLGVLFGTVMVDMMGFGIVLPLLPFYAEEMGASPRWVTLIIASFSITQLLSAPIWGRFSDRLGRRRLLLIGLFASALSYLLFALADNLWLLLVSRATAGAAGGTLGIAQAYVADSTEGEERARGLGFIGAASGLGIMLGPAIGGFFSRFGLGVPGYVAAGLCLLNLMAAVVFLPESRHFRSGKADASKGEAATILLWAKSLFRFPLRVLLLVYVLTIGCFTSMTSVLALYAERVFAMTAADMGLVFTLAGGVTVIVRGGLVGRIVKRFGEPNTVRAGCALLALGVGAIPFLADRWQLWLLVPSWAAATGLIFPSLHALISRNTDEHSQGSVLGGSQVAGGLGRVVAPLAAGWLFELYSIRSPFLVGAAASAVALWLALRIPAPRDHKAEKLDPTDRWTGPVAAHEPRDLPDTKSP